MGAAVKLVPKTAYDNDIEEKFEDILILCDFRHLQTIQ